MASPSKFTLSSGKSLVKPDFGSNDTCNAETQPIENFPKSIARASRNLFPITGEPHLDLSDEGELRKLDVSAASIHCMHNCAVDNSLTIQIGDMITSSQDTITEKISQLKLDLDSKLGNSEDIARLIRHTVATEFEIRISSTFETLEQRLLDSLKASISVMMDDYASKLQAKLMLALNTQCAKTDVKGLTVRLTDVFNEVGAQSPIPDISGPSRSASLSMPASTRTDTTKTQFRRSDATSIDVKTTTRNAVGATRSRSKRYKKPKHDNSAPTEPTVGITEINEVNCINCLFCNETCGNLAAHLSQCSIYLAQKKDDN